MKFDLAKDDAAIVHSQRDNSLRPSGACGATSAVNAMIVSDIAFDFESKDQPEDVIMKFLDSKEDGWKKLKEIDPGATYNPWNTSSVISWAVNTLVGRDVVSVEKYTLQDMIFHIIKEQAAIVIGAAWTGAGHFVAISGFETAQEDILEMENKEDINLKKLQSMIIVDSWGNYLKGYKDFDKTKASIVAIPIATFNKVVFMDKFKTCQPYFKK